MISVLLLLAVAGFFTNGIATDIPPDYVTCLFVSTKLSVHSREYQALLDMNTTACIRPNKQDKETNEHSGNVKITCKNGKKSSYKYVDPKCFCAGIPTPLNLECDQKQLILCCEDDKVACFNGGHLKEESNCNAKPEPIVMCNCPTVLNGTGGYQGDRCQNISVMRKCNYQSKVNDSYNNCDDEKNFDSPCIHTDIDRSYECGPIDRDLDDLGKKYVKCRSRNVYSTQAPGNKTSEAYGKPQTDPDQASLIGWVIGSVLMTVVILVIAAFVCRKRLPCRNSADESFMELQQRDQDPQLTCASQTNNSGTES